jgi:Voltage gated chloride channel
MHYYEAAARDPGSAASIVFGSLIVELRPRMRSLPPVMQYVQPALAGLLIGLIGTRFPQVMGAGYEFMDHAMHGQYTWQILGILAGLKILSTTLSFVSGTPGGMFAPTLFIGAMLGAAIGTLEHALFPHLTGSVGAYALVGMGRILRVEDAMRPSLAPVLRASDTVFEAIQKVEDSTEPILLVYDDLGSWREVSRESLREWAAGEKASSSLRSLLQTRRLPRLHPDHALDHALREIGETPLLPVVHRANFAQLEGVISIADILAAYRRAGLRTGEITPEAPEDAQSNLIRVGYSWPPYTGMAAPVTCAPASPDSQSNRDAIVRG